MATFNQGYRRTAQVDLFTDAYRVSGTVMVGSGGLISELDNPNSAFLEVQEAYISRLSEPGHIVASYGQTAFRKDNINFIVLQDRRDGVSTGTQHARSIYTRGRPTDAFLTIPAFELRGELLVEGKPDPTAIMVHSPGNYVSLFAAQAQASLYPEIVYRGDLILAQKRRIGALALGAPHAQSALASAR